MCASPQVASCRPPLPRLPCVTAKPPASSLLQPVARPAAQEFGAVGVVQELLLQQARSQPQRAAAKAQPTPADAARRCVGTLGSWCPEFLMQQEAPAVTAPQGTKRCNNDCNQVGCAEQLAPQAERRRSRHIAHPSKKLARLAVLFCEFVCRTAANGPAQVGVCSALTGLCTCPAGRWCGCRVAVACCSPCLRAVRTCAVPPQPSTAISYFSSETKTRSCIAECPASCCGSMVLQDGTGGIV